MNKEHANTVRAFLLFRGDETPYLLKNFQINLNVYFSKVIPDCHIMFYECKVFLGTYDHH